ncbi:MAG: AmmeMemoRadiSam system protein B, partial [Candidatus Micrarchaeia archaeon]
MRKAVFNGSFYPYSKEEIQKQLRNFFEGKTKKGEVVALVAPHAGYEYSGEVAAFSHSQLKDFEGTLVIIGPNHTGFGSLVSVSMQDWETPLGIVETNKELAKRIIKNSKFAEEDEVAHVQE